MSRKVEQLQQLLVKIATALQMKDTTKFSVIVDEVNRLRATRSGIMINKENKHLLNDIVRYIRSKASLVINETITAQDGFGRVIGYIDRLAEEELGENKR